MFEEERQIRENLEAKLNELMVKEKDRTKEESKNQNENSP